MINIENLTVSFEGRNAVENVSFSIKEGEIVGIVGESGSGKSVTALTMMGLLSDSAKVESGKITFDEMVLVEAGKKRDDNLLRQYQGRRMSMVFQEPMTSLNPTMRVGKQVEEVLLLHTDLRGSRVKEKVLDIFKEAGLKNPETVYFKYPHELSGGMRQRVMIAIALVLEPSLIIADEPTTALDVTIQAQIIELLKGINQRHHNSMLFITHDLNLAKKLASKLIVMHNGHVVETGTPEEIFRAPAKEYTKMLISAVPQRKKKTKQGENLDKTEKNNYGNPVLTVKDLDVFYKEGNRMLVSAKKNQKQVVKSAEFSIYKGEVLGLVGESGCGKTSLSRAIIGLNDNYTGQIQHFTERPQMIFQDPYSSLNPSKTIGWLLEEPLRVRGERGSALKQAAVEMLKKVGLDEGFYNRRPAELSGGQRQRISIAQALITKPEFVIADEPVSALDVTIQAQIMDLMMELKEDMGLSYLFISHDINIVYQISDRIMVMRDGSIVEIGQTERLFNEPKDEYTKILLA
ncbi:MAG: ABC transporter ATP-binding protein [Eubacteriales bacterium]|nr:ABC transporter ATP-binding protein [Eubacteriales bacterium]